MVTMSFNQYMHNSMSSLGMFDSQITAVMERCRQSSSFEEMQQRWNHDVSEYPENMIKLLERMVLDEALAYIEETTPLAWFKPMLMRSEDQKVWADANGFNEYIEKRDKSK